MALATFRRPDGTTYTGIDLCEVTVDERNYCETLKAVMGWFGDRDRTSIYVSRAVRGGAEAVPCVRLTKSGKGVLLNYCPFCGAIVAPQFPVQAGAVPPKDTP